MQGVIPPNSCFVHVLGKPHCEHEYARAFTLILVLTKVSVARLRV